MKKGDRRKANHKRNQQFVAPQGVKPKKRHKNPAFGALDAASLRKIVNEAIGMALVRNLGIDFVSIMENMPDLPEAETETVQ